MSDQQKEHTHIILEEKTGISEDHLHFLNGDKTTWFNGHVHLIEGEYTGLPISEDAPQCTECGNPLTQEDIDAGETICLNCAGAEFMAEIDEESPLLATVRVTLNKLKSDEPKEE